MRTCNLWHRWKPPPLCARMAGCMDGLQIFQIPNAPAYRSAWIRRAHGPAAPGCMRARHRTVLLLQRAVLVGSAVAFCGHYNTPHHRKCFVLNRAGVPSLAAPRRCECRSPPPSASESRESFPTGAQSRSGPDIREDHFPRMAAASFLAGSSSS